MNVLSVEEVAGAEPKKQITVMFGGAFSGAMQVSIRHSVYGLIDTTGMILDVSASVTSFTPKVGSIYGGTLLTITGNNFGTVITDNPVQLSYNGGVGSTDCFVKTTSATEITCRVDTALAIDPKETTDDATMVVFLKTSEEAVCDEVNVCNWQYTDSLPTITGALTEFDVT